MSKSTSTFQLPMGLNLTPNELLVLLCFKVPNTKLCFPDCNLSVSETTKTIRSLISKQLVVKRQYYNLTKKGKSIRDKLPSILEVN